MRPVMDRATGRHVGWEGPRSDAWDAFMARPPLSLTAQHWPDIVSVVYTEGGGHKVLQPRFGSDAYLVRVGGGQSNWQAHEKTQKSSWAFLTHAEALQIDADTGSDKHPGPMPWWTVVFFEWFGDHMISKGRRCPYTMPRYCWCTDWSEAPR